MKNEEIEEDSIVIDILGYLLGGVVSIVVFWYGFNLFLHFTTVG